MEKFKEEVSSLVEETLGSEENFEKTYEKYREKAENLLNLHSPLIDRSVNVRPKPGWMDNEYKVERSK